MIELNLNNADDDFEDIVSTAISPEDTNAELIRLFNELFEKSYYHENWLKCCEILYNMDPIDLNDSWDWTDEEKAAIAEAKRIADEEEERKRQELEERKNTPGYCHLCGAPDAEYIPFEEMYMCRDCYYNSKY